MKFSIKSIVNAVGESFSMSGVTITPNLYGDPTESYTSYFLSGIVEVMDGTEDEVKEGLLKKEDIMVFVDEDETNASNLATGNYVTIATTTSGVFKIGNVIHNAGHFEVWAKRVLKT